MELEREREREREGGREGEEEAQWPLELWSLSPYSHGQARPAQMQGSGGRDTDPSPRGRSCTLRARRLSLQGRVEPASCPQSAPQATLGTCARSPAPLPSLRLSLLPPQNLGAHCCACLEHLFYILRAPIPPHRTNSHSTCRPCLDHHFLREAPTAPLCLGEPLLFSHREQDIHFLSRTLQNSAQKNGVFHVSPLECKLSEGSVPVGSGPSSSDNVWCIRAQ